MSDGVVFWFSPSTNGFYRSDFCSINCIPKDYVEISERDYLYFLTQNHKGAILTANSSTGLPQLK